MARRLLAASVLGAMAICTAFYSSAQAQQPGQPPCKPRGEALALLEQRYQETPVAIGVTAGGGLLEILATADGSTWTALLTDPRTGVSCLVGSGEGWRAAPVTVPGRGA